MLRVWIVLATLGCGTTSTPPTTPAPGSGSAPPVDAAIPVVVVDAPPPPPPLPLDRDLPRLAERAVALWEALVAAFRAAGADCAAATQSLAKLRTEYGDVTAANHQVHQQGRERELKAALAKHDAKLDAAAREIVGSRTMSQCADDRGFTQAFDDLVGVRP
jgi:hypothetical protein